MVIRKVSPADLMIIKLKIMIFPVLTVEMKISMILSEAMLNFKWIC